MTTYLLYLAPVLAGVAIGYARSGRLSALAGRLRAPWLLWLAVVVQASQLHVEGVRALVEDRLGVPMLVLVFGIALGWLALNIRGWPPPGRVAAGVGSVGALLNAATIAANGRMPYSPSAAARVGLAADETTAKNTPAGDGTWLPFLGDVIPIVPLHKVVSIGDVLTGIGIAALVAALMRSGDRRRTSLPEGGDTDANHQPAYPGDPGRLRPGDSRDPALHRRRALAGELTSRRPGG